MVTPGHQFLIRQCDVQGAQKLTFSLALHFRYIKTAVLPMIHPKCCTKAVVDLQKPTFGETFSIAMPLKKLYTKTLQVTLWCTDDERCLVRVLLYFVKFYCDSESKIKS